jgi:glycerophosphoryl diester phosphodiesterase
MNIICHRGYWKNPAEKNTFTAFKRGYELGLGTETDIRDHKGKLVISHDPATGDCIPFSEYLAFTPKELPLALNVKADGIAKMAKIELENSGHENFFFFDMSIPDMYSYLKLDLPVALRLSEVEAWTPQLAKNIKYIWLDAFQSTWYSTEDIKKLLAKNLHIMIVSAELHGREYHSQWQLLEQFKDQSNLTLCTDYPEQALQKFCEEPCEKN